MSVQLDSHCLGAIKVIVSNVASFKFFASPCRISSLQHKKVKVCRPYSNAERRVPELIPVLGSQPASDVSHKPGGRLTVLSVRPAVTFATLKRAAANFAAWLTEVRWV